MTAVVRIDLLGRAWSSGFIYLGLWCPFGPDIGTKLVLASLIMEYMGCAQEQLMRRPSPLCVHRLGAKRAIR